MINKECHAILLKCMVEGLQINQLKSEKEKKKAVFLKSNGLARISAVAMEKLY